jgi:hypothetical protein
MGALTVIFKVIQDVGVNISLFVEEISRVLCILTGVEVEDDRLTYNSKSLSEKFETIKDRFSKA